MKHLSLATRYRPQTFADVAGQPMAATALSRAALEDRVAPAYLLSGTRGVGKTTIARIFAKALNCVHAPAGEPCNECAQCRHITAGNHVDVSEIDGASNTGVDDVRALRETIGFAPMEGRYKIFIIDEAHMLSKNAFNALLKTLEEPPGRTVFIFATTEAHRFPATIISRCQHFVFRHLPERAIFEHLVKILEREGKEYDESAVRLLARRAAGSVRDSLSLLDQALSLSGDRLEAATVRGALGIAGPELFANLFDAIAACDCARIVDLSSGLLASGVDMGFFTRELGAILRNLFLAAQTGGKILQSLPDVTGDEIEFIRSRASRFGAAHLHAAWQLTLESQRGIAQSPEPGAALEMLLLNLALLPRLLPVGAAQSGQAAVERPPSSSLQEAPREWPAEESAAKRADAPQASPKNVSPAPDGAKNRENWGAFCEFCRDFPGAPASGVLRALDCEWTGGRLVLKVSSSHLLENFEREKEALKKSLAAYCGGVAPKVEVVEPARALANGSLADLDDKPELKLCCEILDASITECIEKPVSGDKNAQHERHPAAGAGYAAQDRETATGDGRPRF